MPSLFIDEAAVFPLRAVLFQCLLLLVAVSLEAIVLRRRLQIGFQPSIQYAMTINLLAVVLGWILFLGLEPLLPDATRTQVISYVLFGNFLGDVGTNRIGVFIVLLGLIIFFLTFWVKAKGLELLTWLIGNPIVKAAQDAGSGRFRYRRLSSETTINSPHILAVLQANALSFSAVLLLLFLRHQFG